jgi:predicted peptidase
VQTAKQFKFHRTQKAEVNYLLFLPAGCAPGSDKRWPMILFLHGAGERGTNVWKVAAHGPPKNLAQNTDFPFIVVSPQCPEGRIWSNDLLAALLDEVARKYPVGPRRVYLTGLSMGGYGTWGLGLACPERFAAIAPVVPLQESQRMVDFLKQAGVQEVKFTVYPEAQHDCWTETYQNPELYEWFLKHQRQPRQGP